VLSVPVERECGAILSRIGVGTETVVPPRAQLVAGAVVLSRARVRAGIGVEGVAVLLRIRVGAEGTIPLSPILAVRSSLLPLPTPLSLLLLLLPSVLVSSKLEEIGEEEDNEVLEGASIRKLNL
jgi:hypothetical protein